MDTPKDHDYTIIPLVEVSSVNKILKKWKEPKIIHG